MSHWVTPKLLLAHYKLTLNFGNSRQMGERKCYRKIKPEITKLIFLKYIYIKKSLSLLLKLRRQVPLNIGISLGTGCPTKQIRDVHRQRERKRYILQRHRSLA